MPSITASPSYYINPSRKYVEAPPGVFIILARHGSTEANDASTPRVRGWKDFQLDDTGRIEAQMLGYKVKPYGPKKIVSSDFDRDSQTANIVANIVITNNVETDYDLRTWDVGSFSEQPLKDVNPAIASIYRNPWMKPPGSNESFNDFSARFIGAFERYIKLASIDIYRPLMLITHGKNIALAKTYIDGGNEWESIMPKPAGCAIVSVGLDRGLYIDIIPPIENVIEDV